MSEPYERLKEDVHEHGEAHAVIEEAGAGGLEGEEIEVRKGTTVFDDHAELLTIEGADTIHRVPFDKVVRWYLPTEFGHD